MKKQSSGGKQMFMTLDQISNYANDEHTRLRKPDEDKARSYGKLMKEGNEFPPIILGEFPAPSNRKGLSIVDGEHRFLGAMLEKLPTLNVVIEKYDSEAAMLADMVKRNLQHGIPLKDTDRNRRIKKLHELGTSGKELAKMFDLSEASITRIQKGIQGEGKSGPKEGSTKKGKEELKPYGGKAFSNALHRIFLTMKDKRAIAEVKDFYLPQGEDNKIQPNEAACGVLERALTELQTLAQFIEAKL